MLSHIFWNNSEAKINENIVLNLEVCQCYQSNISTISEIYWFLYCCRHLTISFSFSLFEANAHRIQNLCAMSSVMYMLQHLVHWFSFFCRTFCFVRKDGIGQIKARITWPSGRGTKNAGRGALWDSEPMGRWFSPSHSAEGVFEVAE